MRALFNSSELPAALSQHIRSVENVITHLADERLAGLKRLLEGEEVGIAEFDEEDDRWFRW